MSPKSLDRRDFVPGRQLFPSMALHRSRRRYGTCVVLPLTSNPMNTPPQSEPGGHNDMFKAFFEGVRNNPDKARRYHHGWLNIVAANWGRSQDRKWRLEEEECSRRKWI